jgi:UDP-N-acetylenolpyruvoylglucosamine reductase
MGACAVSALRLSNESLSEDILTACQHAETISSVFRDLALILPPDVVLRRDEAMARRTTLRVGGPADIYVEPPGEAALAEALTVLRLHGVPFRVLGRGSNLLVRDGGFRGVIVSLNHPEFSRIICEDTRLDVGAGAKAKEVAHAARRAGIAGLEFMEGIPGALGGLLRMNAGAMGAWTFDVVESLRAMDWLGQIETKAGNEIAVTYRSCPYLKRRIALGAVLTGRSDTGEKIQERMSSYSSKRWATQPNQPSAGCTFKNPSEELPAGRLIQELKLKGERLGEAMISDLHGNFFVNLGKARAADVLGLIRLVQKRAWEERGVELEIELEILGED